uniref:Acetyltransferase component of pyruvate dehydrogenase complex n=1 Tax=Araucaria cunninghamii TaxID=56994 RepID=A0A0D6QWL4_ARACU
MAQMIAPLARRSTSKLQANGIFRGLERGCSTVAASDLERRAIAKGDAKPNMCQAFEPQERHSSFNNGLEYSSLSKDAKYIKQRQTLPQASPIIGTYYVFGPRSVGQRHIHWHRIVVDKISAKSATVYLKRGFASDAGLPPHQEIGMPSLSPTMTEGNIAKWRVKEGDKVSAGDVLCEIETDKATLDMETMEEGYVAKILRGDGEKEIKVGELIAIMVEEEEDIAKFKDYTPSGQGAPKKEAQVKSASSPPPPPPQEETSPVESPKTEKVAAPSQPEDRIFASPIARKMAEDHKVPISSIKGTGPNGRIVKADIEDYLASTAKPAKPTVPLTTTLEYADIPLSQIRKVTASRLLLSKQTIPHYYLTVDTRVDKLMELRSRLNVAQEVSGGKRISVNDFVIKAAALALRKIPQCNSSWTEEFIRQYHNVNISIAVQTDNGLFVPVVKDADKKGLSVIAEDVKNLAQKAKEGTLKPADYEGGTFTVSNLGGPFGIKQFCAIINPPQAGILAVGSAEKRVIPGAVDEQFDVGSFMSVTLSCDHRVIDGAIGAQWLGAFKGYIEDPMTMLL